MPGPLGPSFDELTESVKARMAALGHPVVVTSKRRSAQEQQRLYASGRSQPGPIVTEMSGQPGQESRHQLGLAADFAFVGPDGQPSFDNGHPWQLLGQVAKEHGLEWGGDWTTLKDRPHVQQSLRQTPAQRGTQVGEGYTSDVKVSGPAPAAPALTPPPGAAPAPSPAAAPPHATVGAPGFFSQLQSGVQGLVARERASLARRQPQPVTPDSQQAGEGYTVPGSVQVTNPSPAAAPAPAPRAARAAAAPTPAAQPATRPAPDQPAGGALDPDAIAAKYGGAAEEDPVDAIAAKYGGGQDTEETQPSTYSTSSDQETAGKPSTFGALRNALSDIWGMGVGTVQTINDFMNIGQPWNMSGFASLPEAPQAIKTFAGQMWNAPVDTTLKAIYEHPISSALTVASAGELGGAALARTGMLPKVMSTPHYIPGQTPPPVLPPPPGGVATDAYTRAQGSIAQRGGAAKAKASEMYETAFNEQRPPRPHVYADEALATEGAREAMTRQRTQAMPVFDRMQAEGQFGGERTTSSSRDYAREAATAARPAKAGTKATPANQSPAARAVNLFADLPTEPDTGPSTLGEVRVPTGRMVPEKKKAGAPAAPAAKKAPAPGNALPVPPSNTFDAASLHSDFPVRGPNTPAVTWLGTPAAAPVAPTAAAETPQPPKLVPETVSFREAHESKGIKTPFRQLGIQPATPQDRLAYQGRQVTERRMAQAARKAGFSMGKYDAASEAYQNYMDTFQRGPARRARDVVPAKFNDFILHPERWNVSAKTQGAFKYEAGTLPQKMRPDEVIGRFERAVGPDEWNAARHHAEADLLNGVTEDGVVDGTKLKAELERLDRHGVTDRVLPHASDLRAYAEHRISQAQFQTRLRAAAKIAGIATGGLVGTELYRNYDRLKELFNP